MSPICYAEERLFMSTSRATSLGEDGRLVEPDEKGASSEGRLRECSQLGVQASATTRSSTSRRCWSTIQRCINLNVTWRGNLRLCELPGCLSRYVQGEVQTQSFVSYGFLRLLSLSVCVCSACLRARLCIGTHARIFNLCKCAGAIGHVCKCGRSAQAIFS